ncbi:MAG: hypothetical protein HYW86_02605 [Candidatus Roizmanbacteria bacterium]|nr:MAG: hypothetical protein HYW86_02605 [Candidatus Roizmanbacteria bacterium]
MTDEKLNLSNPVLPDSDGYRLQTLATHFEKRKPYFEKIWKEKTQTLINQQPQVGDGEINYVLCGSNVYTALAIADKSEEIVVKDGKVEKRAVQVSPLTKAGLTIPLLIPGDVDAVSIKENFDLKMPFDVSKPSTSLFWKCMPEGMRMMVHSINGQEVYTVHPVDNFVFRLVAQFIGGSDHSIDKIPKKLDQILRSLSETWSMSEIRQRAIEAIKALSGYRQLSNESIQKSKFLIDLNMNQPIQYESEINVEDFLPSTYGPLKFARERGLTDELPTLTNFLDSLSGSHENVSKESRAARITNYLNSNEYIDKLQRFDERHRSEVIGLTTEYFILHPDGQGADDFVRDLQKVDLGDYEKDHKISKLLADSIAQRLGINDVTSREAVEQIYNYYLDSVIVNGVYFHSFNGAFELSIRANGLTTDQRLWDWEELRRISEIGEKTGRSMLLGWGSLNSKGNISYASTTRDSYRYAVASPEWFAQFVSEGFHIPNNEPQKKAYYRGDYEQAKQNIEELCNKMQSSRQEDIDARKSYSNISMEERTEILSFFEKYWKVFRGTNSQPCLALINCSMFDDDPVNYPAHVKEDFGSLTEYVRDYMHSAGNNPKVFEIIKSLRYNISGGVDKQTEVNISPEEIEIVKLPEYSKVFPK